MFLRVIIGSLIAAAVLFLWGFVYWQVLPFSNQVIKPLANETDLTSVMENDLASAMAAGGAETGVYYFPHMPVNSTDEAALEDYKNRHMAGPIGMIFYRAEGTEPMPPKRMAWGYLQMLLAALAAAIVLSASDVQVYSGRVMIVFWMGVFAACLSVLSDVAWFYFPMNYFWLKFGYYVSSGLILGIVLAMFVRPPRPA
jgi:hypothetical protein